jgi:hypothetical protein
MKTSIFLAAFILFTQTSYTQEEIPIDSSRARYYPGDHELMLMPTAYTMESGDGYFSNYEILFLNFTYAPTSRTHIGTFFFFPVVTSFYETITLGVKQNYLKTDFVQAALWGSYTLKNGLYTIGSVFSLGDKDRANFHAGFGYAGESNNNIFLILLGARFNLSPKISTILEYTNAKELLDQDFNGLFTFGIRFRGESSSWELAAIRPLASTGGEFLFLPLLKASFYF